VETRETTFSTYQNSKESIVAALEPLLEKFNLDAMDNDDKYSKGEFTFMRKLGIKISNLSKKEKKKLSPTQKTLFDYL
ncbi:MAG: hypothetical protein M3M88_04115, partial [Thermoproteota archaeon]|nr:hypothetical protein [Thermoproteota archaeon]